MFSTLESSRDQSAHWGWSAAASYSFQALALSLLLAIPLFWVQGPPRLQWLQTITAPQTLTPPVPVAATHQRYSAGSVSNILNEQLLQPRRIPLHAVQIDDWKTGPPAPNLPNVEFGRGGANAIPYGIGDRIPAVPPAPPNTHPLKISHWAEANLIYRVQPVYPPLARQARIQGPVQLRAIISKTGTIEHLAVVSGHPMLVKAAVDAVQQWRYRAYLLNDEPVEIETEITVNLETSKCGANTPVRPCRFSLRSRRGRAGVADPHSYNRQRERAAP